jgi:3-hydroxyisobutyrate dehydrogenase
MTTSSPALAKEIALAAQRKQCSSIDAPVSGGDVGAKNATLSIMIGGEPEPIDRVMPLLQVMGKTIKVMGGVGAGQHTKMANQILIATTMIGMVEGLLYAQRAGLDLNETIAAVGAGAAGSWSINNYGPRLVRGDIAPGFMVEHFVKDLQIALEESAAMGLQLPGLELAHSLYRRLMDMGHSKSGTHSLMLALADMNKISFQASSPWVTKKD